jgi:hypothetical protein
MRINTLYCELMYTNIKALHNKLSYSKLTAYSFVSYAPYALTGTKLRSPVLPVRNQTHKYTKLIIDTP